MLRHHREGAGSPTSADRTVETGRPPHPSRVRRLVRSDMFGGLTGLACGVLIIALLIRAVHYLLRPEGIDLTTYLEAARAISRAESPYRIDIPFAYLYPPTFAWILGPLSRLPDIVVAVLWFSAQLGLLAWLARVLTTESCRHRPDLVRLPFAAGLLAVLLPMFRCLHANLGIGQVNVLMVALVIAHVLEARACRPGRAGLWLALAITTKVTPVLLVAFSLIRRDFRTLACTVGWFALLNALPTLTHDLGFVRGCWQDFLELVLVERGAEAAPFHTDARGRPIYFTLWGLLAWFTPTTAQHELARYACAGLSAALGIGSQLWLQHRAGPAGGRELHAAAVYLAVILLISPMSQKHHLVLLLPAVLLGTLPLTARVWHGGLGARPARLGVTLWIAIVGCLWLSKVFVSGPLYVSAVLLAITLVMRAAWTDAARPPELPGGHERADDPCGTPGRSSTRP